MTPTKLLLALSMAAALPVSATSAAAPSGDADTRYCMRVEPVTGGRLERIRCWTRQQWAEQGVDIDQDWAREGVRTID